jgi:O-antigen/teichoic acid export membrane protein
MRSLALRVLRSDFLRHGSLVLAATMLGNIAAFGYHAIVSRNLGVQSYGTLYALISFASLATLPVGFFPTVVVRYAAEFHSLEDGARLRALTLFVLRVFGGIGLLTAILVTLLSFPLASFLHVPVWAMPAAAILAAVALLSPILRSVLQGDQDFAAFSWSAASEGFGKLLFGATFVYAGFGLLGGLAGFAMGAICSLAISALRLNSRFRGVGKIAFSIDWRRVMQTSLGAISATVAAALLASSDIILVKHFFTPQLAGLYAAASLGGKIILFGVGFAPTVLLPKATLRHARGERTAGTLFAGIGMVAALGLIAFLAFYVAGPLLLRILVGRDFTGAAAYLPWYGLAMIFLAGTNLLISYALALHRLSFVWPLLIAAAIEPAGLAIFHASLAQAVTVLIVANAVALGATGSALLIDTLRLRKNVALPQR